MTWQPISTAPTTDRCPAKDCGGILLRLSNRKGYCVKCQGFFERPKVVHKHRTEKIWEPEEIAKVVEGLKHDGFKQLAIRTLFAFDLRRAELVGGDDVRVPREQWNPGLRWENVREDGIWVRRKMHSDMEFKKNPQLVKQILDFFEVHVEVRNGEKVLCSASGNRKEGKIFERSTDWVRNTVQSGAKKAGFEDWKMIHPHSVRHTMTTWTGEKYDVTVARDTAGHKSIATTNRYLARTKPSKLEQVGREALAIV